MVRDTLKGHSCNEFSVKLLVKTVELVGEHENHSSIRSSARN